MRILIDAMGGDHAPKAPVLGAIEAVKAWNANVALVGREEEILAAAKEAGYETSPSESIRRPTTMEDSFFLRQTLAGSSCISTTSGAWMISIPEGKVS